MRHDALVAGALLLSAVLLPPRVPAPGGAQGDEEASRPAPAAASEPPGELDVVQLPVLLESGLVFLTVDSPAEGPLLALLDTGASASAIDPRRSSALPALEETEVEGTTGVVPAQLVLLEGLRLGALELPALRATRRDLGGLLAPPGQRVDLILGSDALAALVVTIDFEVPRLELARESPAPRAQGGVPMLLDNRIPLIEAELGGIPAWLRIDTGASLFDTPDVYVNVPAPLWRALRERHPGLAPTTSFQGAGAGGAPVELLVAPLPSARIGPLEPERAFVIVQPEVGYFARPDAQGFVGNNFLRRLGRVTLDYRAGRLRQDP